MAPDSKSPKADPALTKEATAKTKSAAGEAVAKAESGDAVAKAGGGEAVAKADGGEAVAKAEGRRHRRRTFQLQPGRRPKTGHCGLQGKLERDFCQEKRKEKSKEEQAITRAGNGPLNAPCRS